MDTKGRPARRTYGVPRALTVLATGVAATGFWVGVVSTPSPSQAQVIGTPPRMAHGPGAPAAGDPTMQHGAAGHGDMREGMTARPRLRTRGS